MSYDQCSSWYLTVTSIDLPTRAVSASGEVTEGALSWAGELTD